MAALKMTTCRNSVDEAQRVDLGTLFREVLGDPDELLPLIRAKTVAGKYDFKEQIKELKDLIQPLRSALRDQRERAIRFSEQLHAIEEDVSKRLQNAENRIAVATQTIRAERDQVVSAADSARGVAERHAAAQAQRADAAEARLQERAAELEAELQASRKEAEDAKAKCKAQDIYMKEITKRKEESRIEHEKQLERAAQMMKDQLEEAQRHQERMQEVACKSQEEQMELSRQRESDLKALHQQQLNDAAGRQEEPSGRAPA